MVLSEILSDDTFKIGYQIINEHNFDTLGLVGADIIQSFCTFIENEMYLDNISPMAKMVITKQDIAPKIVKLGKGVCIVDSPRITFFSVHNYLQSNHDYIREKMQTSIGRNCRIHELSPIPPHNVIIGDNVTIEEFVSIKENAIIGNNVIIRAGSVIGGEGFEFKPLAENIMSVKHLGSVMIKDNVEIQHNSCIDKAVYPWDQTIVGEYTKIDNLVHIAHGVKIGKRCMIVANAGIGGRVEIGNDCWIGFGAIIRNGLTIGDKARVNMGAVVTKNVASRQSVSGNFAIDHKSFIQKMKNV